jgi:hypothetical protein
MLPAGSLEAEELCFQATGRQHVELIGIINKPLLLHLVGCLYYLKKEIVEAFGKPVKENISMGKPDGMRLHRRPTKGYSNIKIILKK